ncbi:amidase family protein, partial [Xanthomonas citri]
MTHTAFWTLADWQSAYAQGAAPAELLSCLIAGLPQGDVAWISRLSLDGLQSRLAGLAQQLMQVGGDLSRLPLYGVPFAAKDNIDVAGLPTTCACPEFAYQPTHNAAVIDRL